MWQVDLTTIVAFLVGVLATGRLARLVVDDDWPPIAWLREKYILNVRADWAELVTCSFCVSIWFALPNLLLAWASGLAWWWWCFNLWFAGAYIAGMVVARDVPDPE